VGQQQLLLIVLGLLIVGMMVYGALRIEDHYTMVNTRDRVRQEGILLLQYAEEHKLKPRQLGGGGGSYTGFQLPQFFIDEPDIGYWVVGSGQNVQVYACSWGPTAVKGEDGKTAVAVLITKTGNGPPQVSTLN
jgi:hypothetical protein